MLVGHLFRLFQQKPHKNSLEQGYKSNSLVTMIM